MTPGAIDITVHTVMFDHLLSLSCSLKIFSSERVWEAPA